MKPINSISATEFKAQCLALLDQVAQQRVSLVVTKHGRPVARLVPYDDAPASAFGILAGTVTSSDDLVAPTGETWAADA